MIFQNACLKSASNSTHKVDRWMVKYLLQHALVLDEKDASSELQGFAVTPANLQSVSLEVRYRGEMTHNAFLELIG